MESVCSVQSIVTMSTKRHFSHSSHLDHDSAAKRPHIEAIQPATHSCLSSLSSTSLGALSSADVQSPSSDWAQLPTELLSLVLSYACIKLVMRMARVNRRLRCLLVDGNPRGPSHHCVWKYYPSVWLQLVEVMGARTVRQRTLTVGRELFYCKSSNWKFAGQMLSVLRHVTALHLWFDRRGGFGIAYACNKVSIELMETLGQFKQLRSLKVRHLSKAAASSFAVALDALPALTSLVLRAHALETSQNVTAALHRLCSTQLDDLTITHNHLLRLFNHQRGAPMPRLHTLTLVPHPEHYYVDGERILAVGKCWADYFPSLLEVILFFPNLSIYPQALPLTECVFPPLRRLVYVHTPYI